MRRCCDPTAGSCEAKKKHAGSQGDRVVCPRFHPLPIGEHPMKYVIVITGASSGFGALGARALARAGHTVYASMRDTAGRNAQSVAEANQYAKKHGVDLRTVEL